MSERKLIFIVDDSEIYLQLLSMRLERKYDVMGFETGSEALENLHLNPSAIIMDYYMDSVDKSAPTGVDLYKEMKKQGYDIPVIFVSIVEKPEIIEEIKGLGAYGYVSKEDEDLIEKIEECLYKAQEST